MHTIVNCYLLQVYFRRPLKRFPFLNTILNSKMADVEKKWIQFLVHNFGGVVFLVLSVITTKTIYDGPIQSVMRNETTLREGVKEIAGKILHILMFHFWAQFERCPDIISPQ